MGSTARDRAGRGGNKVKEKYGTEHFVKIAKMGGRALVESLGIAFLSAIGRKGGIQLKETRGEEYFQQIGRRGGNAVLATRGRQYFVEMGRKSAASRRARRDDSCPADVANRTPVLLSPQMQEVAREALKAAGWNAEEIAELFSSRVLDDPLLKDELDNLLLEAFMTVAGQQTAGLRHRDPHADQQPLVG